MLLPADLGAVLKRLLQEKLTLWEVVCANMTSGCVWDDQKWALAKSSSLRVFPVSLACLLEQAKNTKQGLCPLPSQLIFFFVHCVEDSQAVCRIWNASHWYCKATATSRTEEELLHFPDNAYPPPLKKWTRSGGCWILSLHFTYSRQVLCCCLAYTAGVGPYLNLSLRSKSLAC